MIIHCLLIMYKTKINKIFFVLIKQLLKKIQHKNEQTTHCVCEIERSAKMQLMVKLC